MNVLYAATRLHGVATMLEDASNEPDPAQAVSNALAHLEAVYRETVRAAQQSGLYEG